MFSEVLKVKPKLDNKDLRKMENDLNSRFKRVAKKFGKGMGAIFKGGALLGLGLAFISKIMNPLKEVQEAIDRTLTKNDDLSTFAKQFGTETGKFAKLVALGEASGISQNDLVYIMTKFQTSLGEQKHGTRDVGLQNFLGFDDTADAFFAFIQSLSKLDKQTSNLIQKNVFGERQILKTADFLQQNFSKQFQKLGLDKISTEKLTRSADKLAGLSDLTDLLSAKRNINDIIGKANVINENVVREKDKAERIKLARENQKISAYTDLKAISNTVAKMAQLMESGIAKLGAGVRMITDKLEEMTHFVDKISKSSRWLRWLNGGK